MGISHECDFPASVRGLPVLTAPKVDPKARSAEIDRQVREVVASGLSVYRIDEEKLRELGPDPLRGGRGTRRLGLAKLPGEVTVTCHQEAEHDLPDARPSRARVE